jgi:hypothetical protein
VVLAVRVFWSGSSDQDLAYGERASICIKKRGLLSGSARETTQAVKKQRLEIRIGTKITVSRIQAAKQQRLEIRIGTKIAVSRIQAAKQQRLEIRIGHKVTGQIGTANHGIIADNLELRSDWNCKSWYHDRLPLVV